MKARLDRAGLDRVNLVFYVRTEKRVHWGFEFRVVQFSKSQALAMAIATVPTIQKWDLSKSGMVLDKIAAICQDFKWLGFQISDPNCIVLSTLVIFSVLIGDIILLWFFCYFLYNNITRLS